MAGDWIKMRTNLGCDPCVICAQSVTKLDAYGVIGRLHKLWSWADEQTVNGRAEGVTKAWIDHFLECEGFADALANQNPPWLVIGDGYIEIPRFERHNGQSAKRRASHAKRMRETRAQSVSDPCAPQAHALRTREEKNREEINTPPNPPPAGGHVRQPIEETEAPERQAAYQAFEHWSQNTRGHGLNEAANEHRKIVELLATLAQEAPILHGGSLVHRPLLVSRAVECLEIERTEFRSIAWACKCVRNRLEQWAASGVGTAGPPREETPEQFGARMAAKARRGEL